MPEASPTNSMDAVIAEYAKHIDKSALIENLRLTPQQRSEKFARAMQVVFELRRNADNSRGHPHG